MNPKFKNPYSAYEKDSKLSENLKISILKDARIAKGLSLESVHEVTKIPMDVLRAIEEGYSVKSVSPFYFRGFVKIYAQYLNVDVSQMIGSYHSQEQRTIIPGSGAPSFDFSQTLSKIFTRQRKQKLVAGLGILLVLFILFKFVSFVRNKISSFKVNHPKTIVVKDKEPATKKHNKATDKKQEQAQANEEKKEAAKAKEETKAAQASNKEKEESKAAAVDGEGEAVAKNVTVTARAKKSTWLRVKSDNQVVFQSTLETGSVETWLANDKIEISGKNLVQLELELNGKMLGSLGREDRQAKTIVVTKDGLTVTK